MLLTSWYTLPPKDFRDRIDEYAYREAAKEIYPIGGELRESDMGSLRGRKRRSSSRRKYDEDDKLNPIPKFRYRRQTSANRRTRKSFNIVPMAPKTDICLSSFAISIYLKLIHISFLKNRNIIRAREFKLNY
ncbi:hypothetical protein ALC60_11895 [Trachymyrmex zeteki]|uniref:Uncharacterized protein n=1 Tax=Mycetomoellerius zeteki TaxID=64791 RepID=A0A151WLY2_9HYME|nr:hypothetical protein ALC60_11895 [Trachymyrmex zeteki]